METLTVIGPAKQETVLVLRTCKADMSSPSADAKGFRWPEKGSVHCQDFEPTPSCGHGLHGALWGSGDGSLFCWDVDAKWLVVEVNAKDIIDLGGKVKFPKGKVVFCGGRAEATAMVYDRGPKEINIIGLVKAVGDMESVTGGYGSTVTGGYRSTVTGGKESTVIGGKESTVTGGDGSTVTGGYRSTVAGGYRSTVAGGDWSTVTGGDGSTVTGGDGSTVTGGYRSTVTGGDGSTVTGGDGSTVTGGDRSTVTGGDGSTVTGGDGSTVTGGDRSTLQVKYWDGNRYRIVVGYVGENGIEAGVKYKVVEGKFVKVL